MVLFITSNASFKECIRMRSLSLLSKRLKFLSRAEAAVRRFLLDDQADLLPKVPRVLTLLSLPELSSSGIKNVKTVRMVRDPSGYWTTEASTW